MTQKWNLQDIRPTEPRRKRDFSANHTLNTNPETATVRPSRPAAPEDLDVNTIVIKNGNTKKKLNVIVAVVGIVLFVGGIFGASYFFSKTTLTVYPEFTVPTVNAEFIAYPEQRDGRLSYEIMTLTEVGERQVAATGERHVEEQARGYLEIIKTTPGTERLIKNTRFRSPDGLIFRIQESVVVPGAVRDNTGTLVPGTIRAEVFSDGFGEEYNLPAGTRFDIPGFQENNLNELFRSIYAENRVAFTGGYKGLRFEIDGTELSTAQQALQVELRARLLAKINEEKPADFIAFPGAISITYKSLPTIQFGENLVTIREEATLQQPLFRKSDFASYLANETVPTYNDLPVEITNIHDLTFAYMDANLSARDLRNETALNFTILGRPQIVWQFDAEQLKTDLAGKPFTALAVVLPAHPGIRSAAVTRKPFYSRSFPDKPEEIIVETKIEESPAL